MTKQEWIDHIKGMAANPYGPGLSAPSEGGNAEAWHQVLTAHRHSDAHCPVCAARNATKALEPKRTKAPTLATAERWMNKGGAKATDGCWVEPDGRCEHGCPSWLLELGLI